MSARFEGAEDFIKGRLEEICLREKESVDEVIFLFHPFADQSLCF